MLLARAASEPGSYTESPFVLTSTARTASAPPSYRRGSPAAATCGWATLLTATRARRNAPDSTGGG
ncbi:MAG: hypothetical protein IT371_31745 [Deltaproteobacteria bacterium]|nr:hypothetical protein [Deltaproteobacteria bacterium]